MINIYWQDLIEMTMCKMDKDSDGKVSFEDYQATVSARYFKEMLYVVRFPDPLVEVRWGT